MPSFHPQHLRKRLQGFSQARRYWIAYSGGLDSEVLLQAVASQRRHLPGTLRGIHVNHGLQPEAPAWAARCRRRCQALGVPLVVHQLKLEPIAGESLEALAREARYRVFRESLAPGDLLLTGHHQDDQAETLLFALVRGSGIKGLSAMPEVAPLGAGWLFRPLLAYSRSDLLDYAEAQNLSWVTDPSNRDLRFDRNYLRARVLPQMAARWPGCAARLARTARHCGEAQSLIEELIDRELPQFAGTRPGTLSIRSLSTRSPAFLRALLRRWIEREGFPPPDHRHLARILEEVVPARPDRAPQVAWSGCEIRRYRDDLFAMTPLPPHPPRRWLPWTRGNRPLPPGLGTLSLFDGQGRPLDPSALGSEGLRVRFQVQGQRCRIAPNRPSRSLKHLFQEAGIPSWLRPYIPYLFWGDRLLAVGDRWICRDVGAHPDLRIVWHGGIRNHPGFPNP